MRLDDNRGSACRPPELAEGLSTRALLSRGDIDTLLGTGRRGAVAPGPGEHLLRIELGRRRMTLADLEALGDGCVIPLEEPAADPVSLYVNDRLVARAELLVREGCLCARIVEVASDSGEAL